MKQTTIYHDAGRFEALLSLAVSERAVMPAVDVVARDSDPGTLLLVVQDDVTWEWVSDGRPYNSYADAFGVLGKYLDRHNAEHRPLSDRWVYMPGP